MQALPISGGEPGIRFAINGSEFEKPENNPAITCDSTYDKNTTCHITKPKLDKNYFTSPLQAFIGNMSALTVLSIAHNSFSGPIPKELGNLKELTMLSFGSNNFSETLPRELVNLVKLQAIEQVICNSLSMSKECVYLTWTAVDSVVKFLQHLLSSSTCKPLCIKQSFLRKDTCFHWELEKTNFFAQIPTSFSPLSSLDSLRISDIYNASSSLDFISALKNLIDLVLWKALISGSIPTGIGEYQGLQILDLGFNNLTGQLPSSLFNMSSLTYL
ncbi:hypothetical protein Pyn_25047 [Prunus yedoensis var. nudiflora]|uniref:LRR receptor-like serine/threonine-protein kinase n=1 Tax=Prunus yedoensis var. nudiflora TaxID=2094558 RepID=A0A314Z551_PRUYE|nr:hypothetical protein Pyn_25047 [Prunus yedoensis var. nudiflora]